MATSYPASYPERVSRLNKHIGQGTLIRDKYQSFTMEGRERVCLLAALAPEVIARKEPSNCPGDVMPKWLAHLTPLIDDLGTFDAWQGTIRRYAKLAGDWHLLTGDAWDRLAIKACRIGLGECQEMTPPNLWAAIDKRWSLEGTEAELNGDQLIHLQDLVNKQVAPYRTTSVPGVKPQPWSPSQKSARKALRALTAGRQDITYGGGIESMWRDARGCHIAQKASIDRMTNLLFDAIQKEIDAALAELG